MRHSRSDEFERALREPRPRPAARWSEVAVDPSAPAALLHRAETLRRAWRPPVDDRIQLLESRCRGKRVLDVGCVAHDVARMDSPQWLHARLASVSGSCLGVDVDPVGIKAMVDRGFDALEHDLSSGLGPVARRAPFDVIVAGELIEHVESVGMMFETAAAVLAPGGALMLTTPNPYAPHRVRAARRGIVWENVDHILYAFPSGIAELAERHGLRLTEVADSVDQRPTSVVQRLRTLRRMIQGTRWLDVGLSTLGPTRVRQVGGRPTVWHTRLSRRLGGRLLGETLIYVVERLDLDDE